MLKGPCKGAIQAPIEGIASPAGLLRFEPMGRRTPLPTVALAAALASLWPSAGAASDFWEEVRDPGMPAHRQSIARAISAYRARRYAEAETEARRAIARRADLEEGHRLLALALGALGRDEDAIPHIVRARELDATAFDDPIDGTVATRIAVRAERWALAGDLLHRLLAAMAADPTRRSLFTDRGDVLQTLGPSALPASIGAYEAALRDGRGFEPRAALGLALALHRSGRAAEAAPLVQQAIASGRIEPVLSAVAAPAAERSARLALVHEASGRIEEAKAAWREAAARLEWAEHANAQAARLEGARTGRTR